MDYRNFKNWCIEQCNGDESQFLVRIDKMKDYCPENCLFMPATEARKFNATKTIKISYNNKELSISDWERETGIPRSVIAYRFSHGWDVEKIFTTPVKSTNLDDKDDKKRLNEIWKTMKQRCYNPNNEKYKTCGAKGICVCDEWKTDFHAFETWAISNGYEKSLTIMRIDLNKNYSPNNCKWATLQEQAKNRSNNHMIEYNGEKMTLEDWSRKVGISSPTIRRRLKAGWSVKDALFTPTSKKKK